MQIENLFLNIGAMKAGTTWLYAMLDHHPDIYFTEEKEIHYFAHASKHPYHLTQTHRFGRMKAVVNRIDENNLPVGFPAKIRWFAHYMSNPVNQQWYVRLFDQNPGKKYCADFSNLYSHLEEDGWNHVKEVAKNVKAVYIMRHPMKRLWSHIKFHAQIAGQLEEFKTWTPEQHYELAKKPFIWENAEYSSVVDRIRKNLTPDQYQIVFFEDIHKSPLEWLKQLEDFLEISPKEYNLEQLNAPVNVSESMKMPGFFRELFQEDLEKEVEKLAAQGLTIPESWNDLVRK